MSKAIHSQQNPALYWLFLMYCEYFNGSIAYRLFIIQLLYTHAHVCTLQSWNISLEWKFELLFPNSLCHKKSQVKSESEAISLPSRRVWLQRKTTVCIEHEIIVRFTCRMHVHADILGILHCNQNMMFTVIKEKERSFVLKRKLCTIQKNVYESEGHMQWYDPTQGNGLSQTSNVKDYVWLDKLSVYISLR